MIGQVLDHYTIEAQLGAGGMGVVYKAYDVRLQRHVAIKFLARPSDDAGRAQILREARAASALNHPHICTIYEVGDAGGQEFIVMEYVEGRALRELVPPDGLAPECAVAYAIQIADALAHAHDHGIVHRDLKTANIVITSEGRTKVLDFGLALRLTPAELHEITTVPAHEDAADTTAGTLAYMAPELLRGQHADARSDIWAIGVVLYEMLTGRLPFNGRNNVELCTEILREPPWPLRASIDIGLRGVVLRCLMKEPRQRYERASEVRAALETIQRELEGPAALPDRVRPAPRALHRRVTRKAILAAVSALVAILALVVPQTRRLMLPFPGGAGRDALDDAPRAIAVFPFRSIGSEAEVGHIARGLTETLAAHLVQSSVHVASADAVERASTKLSVDQAARQLGVDRAVTGTVQQIAGKLRIIVNVEDVTSGRRIWAREVSGERSDLLSMEERLRTELLEALDVAPRGEPRAHETSPPTVNIDAYDLYLKGMAAAREQSSAGARAAIGLYDEALRKDPRFALAYAALSETELWLYRDTRDRVWLDRAKFAAEQAQRLDAARPEVHLASGAVYNAIGQSADAIAALKRAIDLSPNSDEAHRELGRAYGTAGRGQEALESLKKAVEINPYDWENHNALGTTAISLGRYSEAGEAFRKVIELEPDRVNGYSNLGAVYLYTGRFAEAADAFQKSLKLRSHPITYSNLGIAYANSGHLDEAVSMFEKAVALDPAEVRVGNLADGYRWLGRRDKSAPLYDKAIALAYRQLQINPRDADAMARLALYYAKKGDSARAAQFIGQARNIAPQNVDFLYYGAIIHALSGRTPEALETLRQAFRAGFSPALARKDPDFRLLQSAPAFQALITEFDRETR